MLALGVLFVAMVGSLAGQEARDPLTSGPQPDTPWTAVPVSAPSGSRAGTTFDAAAALGDGPSALLFVHELTRNTAPVIRALDRFHTEYGLLGFRAFTVLLADDRTAAEQQAQRSSAALGMRNPLVISTEGSDGPGAYALNRKCTLTLVLGNGGRVTRAEGFTDTGANDVPKIEGWIAALTGPLPNDAAGWRALVAKRFPAAEPELIDLAASLLVQSRRQAQDNPRMRERAERAGAPTQDAAAAASDRPREGRAPDDDELRTLLRAAIQKTATEKDLDDVFGKVDARVGDDAGLRQQAVEMFKLVLSLGYGTEAAQRRARGYVDKHAPAPQRKK
jgi:hypothetical protein